MTGRVEPGLRSGPAFRRSYRPLGHTSFDVPGLRAGETNLANMDTDAMLAVARTVAPTEIALQNRGAIRADLRKGATGALSLADVFATVALGIDPTDASPGYPLTRFFLYTPELRAALELSLQAAMLDPDYLLIPSGLRLEYDPTLLPFDPVSGLSGWITKLSLVADNGTETPLYDSAQANPWLSSSLHPVVTTFQVAAFATSFGLSLHDVSGNTVQPGSAILRRADTSAVKDYQSLAAFVKSLRDLPSRYDELTVEGHVPRRVICTGPACGATPGMTVQSATGAPFDLAGTVWKFCDSGNGTGYPSAGQSYEHLWAFGVGVARISHDVHTGSLDCTGPTDPAQHFEVTMSFSTGPVRTVGWEQTAPPGYPVSVVATGVTMSLGAQSARGVAFVDDTAGPPLLFITNPGDPPAPTDADGYPTQLPNIASAKL